MQWAPVGLLSGGERRRLQLLVVLASRPNVLLLDEPTNDLDLDTLRLVEEFCEDWPGALVVVSHDRAFLDRTVDDVVVVDGSGTVVRHPGGYAAWDEQRRLARRTRSLTGRTLQSGPEGGGGETGSVRGDTERGSARAEPAGHRRRSDRLGRSGRSGRSASTMRHELRVAARQVTALRVERDDLVMELEAASTDHVALAAVGQRLTAVEAALAEAEETWLRLATEAEERGLADG